ncbi:GGDEF domain-containing protein [Deinococcus aestuarii]|uniref:GGDEF domain-containing protein n=1 Tax=Deinococcus aestuarii TaxID=2774531 RepID=UPI001C0E1827|nr:GGDEF domain-containing protein [Deinococcus aestuarii]
MRAALRHLLQLGLPRLLLGVALPAALGGAALAGPGLTSPVYLGLLAAAVVCTLLALAGPPRLRARLLGALPLAHTLLLLAGWLASLYLLPAHPASPRLGLALVAATTLLPASFFWLHPRTATWRAGVALGGLLLAMLPHAVGTLGQPGPLDGLTLPLTLLLAPGALALVLRSAHDQLAQARAQAQALEELAHRDPLTGLPNRRALERGLAQAVQGADEGVLLALIDVDGLKGVNDTLGHAAGDDLLRRFGTGFAGGDPGRASRLGGDEFALLLQGSELEAAGRLVTGVVRQVRGRYPSAGASVGVACWQPGEAAGAWLSRADRRMYRHKARTRGEGPLPR